MSLDLKGRKRPEQNMVLHNKLIHSVLGLLALASCGPSIKPRLQNQQAGAGLFRAMNFNGWDLRNTSFKNADVHQVDFRFALLQGTDFSGADLGEADLRETHLKGADFSRSNVNQARLYEADMRGAIFDQVNWTGHDFRDARLMGTRFRQAQLRQADFTGANLKDSDFSNTDLRETNFRFAQLIRVKFRQANLAGVDFRNRDLRGADFTGADLTGTHFEQANLQGAILKRALLVDTHFEQTNLLQVDFSGGLLDHIHFKGAKIKAPKFAHAQIKRVSFEELDFSHSDFEGAWLRGVAFRKVDLSGSNFRFSKLENTLLLQSNLSSADISHADLSQALLYQTNFTAVTFEKTLFPTLVEPKTGLTFVQAPMGCYPMGDLFGENQGFDETIHQVCVKDFFMSTTEVTQAQFVKLMGYNPSYFDRADGKQPIENINVNEIKQFLVGFQKLTQFKVRLPTEEEWEYACRELGSKVRFGNGKDVANPIEIAFHPQKRSHQVGYYHPKLIWKEPLAVGSFRPNKLGLFDMSGNVAEVVSDPWDSTAYKPGVEKNQVSKTQVVRGGHFSSFEGAITCSKRSFMKLSEMDRHVGFRPVKEIDRADVFNKQRFQLN